MGKQLTIMAKLRGQLQPDHGLEEVHPWYHKVILEDYMSGFPQFYGDFPAMIGLHSAALVWDTYQKGVTNFDVVKAYAGLKKNATQATMLPWRSGPMCSLDRTTGAWLNWPKLVEAAPSLTKQCACADIPEEQAIKWLTIRVLIPTME